jgi:hypothetical protein
MTYQLRYGSLFFVAGLVPLFYIFLQYQTVPALSVYSIGIVAFSLGAVFARRSLDAFFQITPRPLIQSRPGQLAASLVAFVLIGLVNKTVLDTQLSTLSALTGQTGQQIAFLFGTAVLETLILQYLFFSGVFVASILLFRNYYAAALWANIVSSITAYTVHTIVYAGQSQILLFVFISFFILNLHYWITGSFGWTAGIHVWWDVGPIILPLLGLSLPFIGVR